MAVLDSITAMGHSLVQCTHNTTIEVTKADYLTKKGTCILGINASKSCYDLAPELKNKIKAGEKIFVIIKAGGVIDRFYGYGNNNLTLLSKNDLVFRKSNFICDRTILIRCTKSSSDLKRELIKEINKSKNHISIIFKDNEELE